MSVIGYCFYCRKEVSGERFVCQDCPERLPHVRTPKGKEFRRPDDLVQRLCAPKLDLDWSQVQKRLRQQEAAQSQPTVFGPPQADGTRHPYPQIIWVSSSD